MDRANLVSQQSKAMDALGKGSWRCREEGLLTWVLYETQIKQGVLAGSIGGASKESQPDALAKQARSRDRIYWLSN